jgi:hypothetical protein
MHMIQYSYSFAVGSMATGDNEWLKEGTAQWVQDYVSSSHYGVGVTLDQTEHKALKRFFPVPEQSLDSTATYKHEYGSYVFWLWAARKGNDPTLIRQVWNAVATKKSLDATTRIGTTSTTPRPSRRRGPCPTASRPSISLCRRWRRST